MGELIAGFVALTVVAIIVGGCIAMWVFAFYYAGKGIMFVYVAVRYWIVMRISQIEGKGEDYDHVL